MKAEKFPDWKKVKRHTFPEKVLSGEWYELCPYAGAVTGKRLYIKDGTVKWDICRARTLKVGDTIPTGMILIEE